MWRSDGMALKDAYADLTTKERDEREEFVVEACYLMRDRLRGAGGLAPARLPGRASASDYADPPAFQQCSARCCSPALCRSSRTSALGREGPEGIRRHGRARCDPGDFTTLMRQDEQIVQEVLLELGVALAAERHPSAARAERRVLDHAPDVAYLFAAMCGCSCSRLGCCAPAIDPAGYSGCLVIACTEPDLAGQPGCDMPCVRLW